MQIDPVSAAFSSVAERMEQHIEEIRPFAQWLYARGPLVNVLEIGVRWGGTAALWHQLATGIVIGVDWSECPDSLGGMTAAQLKLSMESRYPRYTFVDADSHNPNTFRTIANKLYSPIHSVDLLFLDGDHSYDGVRQDFDMYRPLVSPGGCIAFHDIVDSPFMRSVGHGVWEFWRELEGKKREFCIGGDWGGIGVLEVEG